MKIAFVVLLILHGTLHSMGFIKAFRIIDLAQLVQPIPKSNGLLWLVACLFFIFAAILFSIEHQSWWIFSALAVIISQYLIIHDWNDAKLGTIANIIILLATIIGFVVWTIAKI
ncbi:hypothetical protein [Mucilaginibacter sp. BT774]|uniref:hypothetical protein n=1 Tax=Mucilaginibacter sp. BT774 TaxID=3062276 RepID=UPI002675A8C3|nr:hypothetical protein [Mucilaginibacter sp. BT774]MDO3628232.1 hypothetical protein [Mucilaginibacter sp. BT774]